MTPCSAQVQHDSARHEVVGVAVTAGRHGRAQVADERLDYRYTWSGSTLWLHTPCGDHAFDDVRREPARAAQSPAALAAEVRATINGRVLDVLATAGAQVVAGDRLVVLEAMKMEHEVRAVRAGVVAHIGVTPGDQVVPGQLLIRYEEPGA